MAPSLLNCPSENIGLIGSISPISPIFSLGFLIGEESALMKTLLLNPPSFEKFDGGASSRWPATREIESYWYPVWLSYPAGMLPGSRLLDAPPHHVSPDETVQIGKDFEFLVLFTSTPGWTGDQK